MGQNMCASGYSRTKEVSYLNDGPLPQAPHMHTGMDLQGGSLRWNFSMSFGVKAVMSDLTDALTIAHHIRFLFMVLLSFLQGACPGISCQSGN
jgi:hypothetical protein